MSLTLNFDSRIFCICFFVLDFYKDDGHLLDL